MPMLPDFRMEIIGPALLRPRVPPSNFWKLIDFSPRDKVYVTTDIVFIAVITVEVHI